MIKVTTALRKIGGLWARIKVVAGGQGAGKTIAILILLINHAAKHSDKEIIIASHELTKMRLTVIKDFVKVMKSFGIYSQYRFKAGTLYRFPNGSFIKFIGLDKEDLGKGLRSDIVFINEGNKINFESYRQLTARAKQVFIDFNPDAEFWVHDEVIPRNDCQTLTLTFQDNEMLSKEERDEILRYKALGYDSEGNVINQYWANKWRVYGLGQIGSIEGAVFENWDKVDLDNLKDDEGKEAEPKLLYYGVDFGYSNSKFACVAVYQFNGDYYLKELVYDNELTNQRAAAVMLERGYKKDTPVYCDSAEPKSIKELRLCGINAVKCDSKKDIKNYAIQKLNSSIFYVDEKSVNLLNELRYWKFDKKTGKPEKSDRDHLMDALCYAVGSGEKYTGEYSIGGV